MKVTVFGPVGGAANGPLDPPYAEKATARCQFTPAPDAHWRGLFYGKALEDEFAPFPPSVYKIDGAFCTYTVEAPHWIGMYQNLESLVAVANGLDTR